MEKRQGIFPIPAITRFFTCHSWSCPVVSLTKANLLSKAKYYACFLPTDLQNFHNLANRLGAHLFLISLCTSTYIPGEESIKQAHTGPLTAVPHYSGFNALRNFEVTSRYLIQNIWKAPKLKCLDFSIHYLMNSSSDRLYSSSSSSVSGKFPHRRKSTPEESSLLTA